MNSPSDINPDGETILITDDDKAFCAALTGAFRRRGFKVVVAHDYDDAITEAEAWSPGRAVVDLRMPGRGGLEVVGELHGKHPNMKIVVLTGYGSIATAVEAMKLGAVHYLTKPAEPDEVLAAFERTEPATDVTEESANPRSLEEVEWEHLQRVLTDCAGNISEAARRLGMHRRSLQRKLARGRPGEGLGPAEE
ncbi:MAG: response regulator transcription factor [Nannocystales bacterium]